MDTPLLRRSRRHRQSGAFLLEALVGVLIFAFGILGLVGLELAARAGYDPRAAVTLWQKMAAASKGAPPEWLSTHPSGDSRVKDIEASLPRVMPLYERAEKPTRVYGPPPKRKG